MKVDRLASMPVIMIMLYLLVAAIVVAIFHVKLNWIVFVASITTGIVAQFLIGHTVVSVPAAIAVLLLLVFLLPKDGFKDKLTSKKLASKKLRSKKLASHNVEGYEDVKKAKDENPAPAPKKEGLPMPFTLGEIPSQVKNGPHIDASSTLMKAIQSLNPDQINAMSKDTQQLIETQKSLMGMLGTMKPMLNDGKELMNTFQQMFGQ